MKSRYRVALLAAVGVLASAPTIASAQTWTTWTAANPGDFRGTLLGTTVDFIGSYAAGSQLSSAPTDYFSPTNPYTQGGLTAPDAGGNHGFVQIINPTTATITFSTAVTDLFLAFISVGQPGTSVTYTFDHPFTVLSNNNCPTPAYWGCGSYTTSGNTITGTEFSGTIQFSGTFTSLSVMTDPAENWHGITVGAKALAVTPTPEPATLALFATGLVGLGGIARIRRKSNA